MGANSRLTRSKLFPQQELMTWCFSVYEELTAKTRWRLHFRMNKRDPGELITRWSVSGLVTSEPK